MKIRQIFGKALSPKSQNADVPAPKKAAAGAPHYELLDARTLGEGGYGRVYEAIVDGDPSRRVAVKRIPLSRVREETLHREVRIGRELSHPNIVKVHDSYISGNDFFMVMELVRGGELFDRVIEVGIMKESEAANHMAQLLLAVHHCHSKGVAHRDIKLENVLLQPNGHVKLIDFGLAALHDVVQGRPVPRVLRDKCGSKSYAAPEVNTGKGYNGFAADVWSCGICLFAMLAGFFPLDEAKESDWRFRRFVRAEAAGHATCTTVYGFYGRQCPFSPEAVQMLEGMLRANPFERLRVDELLLSPWIRRNASPRLVAVIDLTLDPAGRGADAARLEEALRPNSAPSREAHKSAAGLQANIGRAYAALTGARAAPVAAAQAEGGALDMDALASAARAVEGGAEPPRSSKKRGAAERTPPPPAGAVVEVDAFAPPAASSSEGEARSGSGEGRWGSSDSEAAGQDIEQGRGAAPVYRGAMGRPGLPPKVFDALCKLEDGPTFRAAAARDCLEAGRMPALARQRAHGLSREQDEA